MTKMRQSCQILRQIEHLKGKATTPLLAELLPEIPFSTIAATVSGMITQDRVHKNGKVPGKRGYFYRVNDDWEPGLARKKRKPAMAGKNPPPDKSVERQASPGNMKIIRFRDKKIQLLQKLHRLHGAQLVPAERDLLIGLLADLGCRPGE